MVLFIDATRQELSICDVEVENECASVRRSSLLDFVVVLTGDCETVRDFEKHE